MSAKADVAQLAERVLGKDEVTSSILVIGSMLCSRVAIDREHVAPRARPPKGLAGLKPVTALSPGP